MTTGKVTNYITQVLITVLGTLGIIGTIYDGMSYMRTVSEYILCVLVMLMLSALWIGVTSYASKTVVVISALIPVVAGLILLVTGTVKSGVCSIINEIIYTINYERGQSYGLLLWSEYDEGAMKVTLWLAGIYILMLVGYNVSRIRSMCLSLLHVLAIIAVLVTFNVIPSYVSIVLCMMYVFGVSALRPGVDYSGAAVSLMSVTLALSIVLGCIVNEDTYEKPEYFDSIRDLTDGLFEGGDNFIQSIGRNDDESIKTGNGLSDDGRLGDVDKVSYNNSVVMKLTTTDIGKRQYIAINYGTRYMNYLNSWKMVSADADSVKTEQTYKLLTMLEGSPKMRSYVFGDDKSVSTHMKGCKYSYKDYVAKSGSKSGKGLLYYVDETYFSKFYELANGNVEFNNLSIEQSTDLNEYISLASKLSSDASYSCSSIDAETYAMLKEVYADLEDMTDGNAPYETLYKVKKIRDFVTSNYEYTLTPGRIPEGEQFLSYFLKENKKGYCTYFATAGAMLLRAAGVSARYVEGYVLEPEEIRAGERTVITDTWEKDLKDINKGQVGVTATSNGYEVVVKDTAAHAWVEVYIEGYGWMPVEFTPGYDNGGIGGTNNNEQSTKSDGMEDGTAESGSYDGSEDSETVEGESGNPATDESGTGTVAATDDESEGGEAKADRDSSWAAKLKNSADVIFMVAVCVIILVLLVIAVIRYVRRLREVAAIYGSDDIIMMYSYLERILGKLGYHRPESMTYESYARYLQQNNEVFMLYDFSRITEVALKVRFGGDTEYIDDDVKKACRDISRIREDIIGIQPVIMRFRLKYIYML